MSIKRYDGSNWVEPSNIKRYDGSNWVDVDEIKRYDGSNWITVFVYGTRYRIKATGINTSGYQVLVSEDGTLTFTGLASTSLPNILVLVDYDVPASTPAYLVATCRNNANLPTVILGFRNSTGLKDSSKTFNGTLNSSPNTLGSGNLTSPNVISNPYALFMGKTQLAIGTGVSFVIKFNNVAINGVQLPTPFSLNKDKSTISGEPLR